MERDDHKEVFAFFGRAAYFAQVLEQELILFATMLSLSRLPGVCRQDVEDLFATFEAKTFGQLLREARKLTSFAGTVDALIQDALAHRNDLIHQFFARHSENLVSARGRRSMITELHQISDLFEEADAAITGVRVPLSSALGVTSEMAARELEAMKARAAVRDRLA